MPGPQQSPDGAGFRPAEKRSASYDLTCSAISLRIEARAAFAVRSAIPPLKGRIDPSLFSPMASEAGKKGARYKELFSTTLAEAKAKAERYKDKGAVDYEWGKAGDAANTYLAASSSLAGYDAFLKASEFLGDGVKTPGPEEVLHRSDVPYNFGLMALYLTIFVAAETAFILMALREYLQDLAHISDLALMGMEKHNKSENGD